MKASAYLLLAALTFPAQAAAKGGRTVAVLNFSNSSGSASLDYLKSALPESISATLSQGRDVRVVERAQIARLLSEIQLEQSGVLDSGEVSRAGKLAKADVLLIGQFSGNPEKLVVILKAVDVTSGVVLDGRTVEAGLGEILNRAGSAASSMMAVVSGKALAYLTVSTSPDDVDVLLDGALIGRSPIVDHKVSAGAHRLFLKKKGFKEAETTLQLDAGARKKLSEVLSPERKPFSAHLGVGYQRLLPQSSALAQGNVIVPRVGLSFGRFTAGAEMGILLNLDHSYSFDSAFGSKIEQKRSYYYTAYMLTFDFEPFPDWTYISPFVGGYGGYVRISDYRRLGDDTEQKLASFDLFHGGARLGFEIMPKFVVSFVIEARYQMFGNNINRSVSSSNGVLGGLLTSDTSLSFTNFSVGGAVRFNLP